MKNPTVELINLTPSLAKKLMKRNTLNRAIKKTKLNNMIRDMKSGNWKVTTNGIGIDTNGVITNGGHRIHAVIESGQTIPIWLFKNLTPESRNFDDTGTIRTLKNCLEMNDLCCERDENGQISKKNNYTKAVASAAAYIILHQSNKFSKIGGVGSVVTNPELVDFVRANEIEFIDSASFIESAVKGKGYVRYQTGHLLFVYQMHKLFNPEKAEEFVEIVCDRRLPEDVDGCPAIRLKEVLIREFGKKKGKLKTKDLMGLYVDASNKFMANTYTKRLNSKGKKSDINNVKFVGEINNKATKFFNAINHSLYQK
jgi:hypothetical protein